MIRQKLIQILLFPLTILYGLGITLRNGLYSRGLLKSARFNLPVIGVGNLSIGGAGKTPHVEYLIRLLSPNVKVATLSRGYKRKNKGFRLVGIHDNALTVGDEPLQYFLKYREAVVAVSESRSVGVPLLLSKRPDVQTILLDDSYQHRSVTPSLNILLTEYKRPYSDDILLPSGRLREWRSASDRADVVIVTKCPEDIPANRPSEFRDQLGLREKQQLFFSRYAYGNPYPLLGGAPISLNQFKEVVVISAIAQADDLHDYIGKAVERVNSMPYEDHHYFSPHEMSLLKLQYEQMEPGHAAIITTEKDATRLILHREYIIKHQLPIYILPVRVAFLYGEEERFDELVRRHLMTFRV
ncbi:MAG: tetraacyldisaccharide 4'-kinase [Saprospiraceae bacterium]|jgi:tetraacyldisaccharide 4'-kinase